MCRWRCRRGSYAICIVAALGCGEAQINQRNFTSSASPSAPAEEMKLANNAEQIGTESPAGDTQPPGSARAKAAPVRPMVARKIIYNAQVELVVESVSSTADALARLIQESGGYISETDIVSSSELRRQATWKVRIPVDRFDAFLGEVTRLGELQKNHLDSQDVTQEYVDLEARIANKQEEEKRLLKHLTDSTGKLEDILAVERELSRVRGEVEQMQGRLRFLANVTALSTVTIVATELKGYTPPVSPSFATRIIRTFRNSVTGLTEFGENLLLFIVAVLPWLPFAAIVALPLWWFKRRRGRRLHA